jgi:hypothetical protein
LRLAYLVHNLADPAVAKRVRMLAAFGDEVTPIGFHRDDHAVETVAGITAIDLGRTFDADFRQRMAMILRQAVNLAAWAPQLRNCDVVIARNLEMLSLGALARWRYAPGTTLVYEALDIHRFLLSQGVLGKGMRVLERGLLRQLGLLVVSSPAFLRDYFEPLQRIDRLATLETLIVENKLLPAAANEALPLEALSASPPAAPWRIGWFGMIRCRKSLDYLCDLATRHPRLLRLSIRGRPSYTEFADFGAQIAHTEGVSFGGVYEPAELRTFYSNVHFNWAIDFFEEGANSRWLLPNRVYEGGAYGAIPITIDGTETARWLRARGIGVVLNSLDDLEEFLLALTPQRYAQLKAASDAAPRNTFVADDSDCRRLLDALGRAQARRAPARAQPPAIDLDLRRAHKARDDAAI